MITVLSKMHILEHCFELENNRNHDYKKNDLVECE